MSKVPTSFALQRWKGAPGQSRSIWVPGIAVSKLAVTPRPSAPLPTVMKMPAARRRSQSSRAVRPRRFDWTLTIKRIWDRSILNSTSVAAPVSSRATEVLPGALRRSSRLENAQNEPNPVSLRASTLAAKRSRASRRESRPSCAEGAPSAFFRMSAEDCLGSDVAAAAKTNPKTERRAPPPRDAASSPSD